MRRSSAVRIAVVIGVAWAATLLLMLAKGDPQTALEFLNHAIAAGHGDAHTLGLLARALWQTGDPDGARDALGRAIALNSRDVELQRLLRTIR